MPSLEVQLEKAEKALKEIQEDVDEKKKNSNKYRVAEFIKKDKSFANERVIFEKLAVAKAKVERLKTKIYNKQEGGRTRRAKRGSKKTRKNGF
jgi:hypothetical protein